MAAEHVTRESVVASHRKVRELLRVSDADEMYTVFMREYITIKIDQLPPASDGCVSAAVATIRVMERLRNWFLDELARFYSEDFSDEEIDQLIEYNAKPVAKKFRESQPAIMSGVIGKMNDDWEQINTIFDEEFARKE